MRGEGVSLCPHSPSRWACPPAAWEVDPSSHLPRPPAEPLPLTGLSSLGGKAWQQEANFGVSSRDRVGSPCVQYLLCTRRSVTWDKSLNISEPLFTNLTQGLTPVYVKPPRHEPGCEQVSGSRSLLSVSFFRCRKDP